MTPLQTIMIAANTVSRAINSLAVCRPPASARRSARLQSLSPRSRGSACRTAHPRGGRRLPHDTPRSARSRSGRRQAVKRAPPRASFPREGKQGARRERCCHVPHRCVPRTGRAQTFTLNLPAAPPSAKPSNAQATIGTARLHHGKRDIACMRHFLFTPSGFRHPLITFAYFSKSARIDAANACGPSATGSIPWAVMASRISGDFMTVSICPCSL